MTLKQQSLFITLLIANISAKQPTSLTKELNKTKMLLNDKKREKILEQRKDEFVADMDDDEFDEILTKLLEERKERKRKRESDMEM